MSVGVFAVVHADTPKPHARQSNVCRQPNAGVQRDKSDTPATKRRKTANAVVRGGNNGGIGGTGGTGGNDMDGMLGVDGSEYAHIRSVEPSSIISIVGGIIVGQATHGRDQDDDFQELVFGPVGCVKNWSLSRWCEKDNEEPVVPFVHFDWPESDDETVV